MSKTQGDFIDEIIGRLQSLEVISMTALGLYLANSRNDPDYSKAAALIDDMRRAIEQTAAANLSPSAAAAAARYGDAYLKQLAAVLPALRGEGGTSH